MRHSNSNNVSQDDVRLSMNMNNMNNDNNLPVVQPRLNSGSMGPNNNNNQSYGFNNNTGVGQLQNQGQPGGIYYSSGVGLGPRIGGSGSYEPDNKSIASTPSKISKFTYSEYPQIRPTNPLYTSTATIKTATSGVSRTSRASTMNTVSRRQKYNPNAPRRISDWRWVSALAVLLFFPTGLIAIGLAIKARTKFNDGFIDEAKKLNKRAVAFCIVSFLIGMAWILTAFFIMDKWPRTNG